MPGIFAPPQPRVRRLRLAVNQRHHLAPRWFKPVAGSDPSAGDPVEGPRGECGSRFEAILGRNATVSDFRAANW